MKDELILQDSIEQFKGDSLAANVFINKYSKGATVREMQLRMAKQFGLARYKRYKKNQAILPHKLDKAEAAVLNKIINNIYNNLKDFKYLVPQGSIMATLGTGEMASLSNCFVVGQPHDSIGGIHQKDEELAQLMKRRGGVGIDLTSLRCAGAPTKNAAKTSTGPVSFASRFSNTTREIAQEGRRGALMITMHINHPDSRDFVVAKTDTTSITGANISIKISDEFMQAVEKGEHFIQLFPDDNMRIKYLDKIDQYFVKGDYLEDVLYTEKIGDKTISFRIVNAVDLWKKIVKTAHAWGEPGIIFEDRHVKYSPDGVYDEYRGITVNPCGEIWIPEYDACRLLAHNLLSYVNYPFRENAHFDWAKFSEMCSESIDLGADVINLELNAVSKIIRKIRSEPAASSTELEMWLKIGKIAKDGRRIGIGFTALGDCLAALGFKYGSQESKDFVAMLMRVKFKSELEKSIDLAKMFGHFKGYSFHKEFTEPESGKYKGKNVFFEMIAKEFPDLVEQMKKHGRYNVSFSTVAPTGTVSLMTQTTSGLEPLFKPYYLRRVKLNSDDAVSSVDFIDQSGDKWTEYIVLHPQFKYWLEDIKKIKDVSTLKESDLKKYFKESSWYQSTAEDIDPEDRVDIQAIIQKFTSHSISSTVNMAENATVEDVHEVYMKGWKSGLKGVTVYRDNCRTGVLVNLDNNKFSYKDAMKRPEYLECHLYRVTYMKNDFLVFVGLIDSNPYEVFITENKEFADQTKDFNDIGKLKKKGSGKYEYKSGTLNKEVILDPFKDENGEMLCRLISTSLRHGADIKFLSEQLSKLDSSISSLPSVVNRILKKYTPTEIQDKEVCPECKCTDCIVREEGCLKCVNCGHSKC